MLSTFLLLGFVAMGTSSDQIFENCPDTPQNLPPFQPVHLRQFMGEWFFIRKGPIPSENLEKKVNVDCLQTALWKEHNGPENVISHVTTFRINETHVSKSGTFTLKPLEDGAYENNFSFTHAFQKPDSEEINEISFQTKLVDSDDGKTWSLWVGCIMKNGNATLNWSIKSRFPRMDAYIEQMLVEKIEKYSGVGATQLRGIGQTNCYS